MDFNYAFKIFIKFFFVTFFIFCASISYSQDDEFNLESDDFDLLEDLSFEELEANLGISNELQILLKMRLRNRIFLKALADSGVQIHFLAQ